MAIHPSELEPQGQGEFSAWPGGEASGASSPTDALLLELSAWLGFARACAHSARVQEILRTLQMDLRRIREPFPDAPDAKPSTLAAERIRWMEETQESLELARVPRRSSDLPGDTVSGAILDLLSIVAQRISREFHRAEGERDPGTQRYLERLPALLFTLARWEEDQANPAP